MTTSDSWHTLLHDIGAKSPRPQLDSHANLQAFPLDYQSLFSINGADALSFLQGQLTCDMREVKVQGSRLAAHCTPKGAMVSAMRVIDFNNNFLIRVNNENLKQTIAQLNKYMMFSKAKATDLSGTWFGLGIVGDAAVDFLQNHFNVVPTAENQSTVDGQKVVIKVPGNRYEIWANQDEIKRLLNTPLLLIGLTASMHWHKLDITNAIADVYPQTSTMFIPQMCNLQALSGVSFNKGCYTGQEVITRLHFRGKLNKQLITAKAQMTDSDNQPEIGQSVHSKEQNNIGKILQCCFINNTCYLQIVVNHSKAEKSLYLDSNIALQTLALPYKLDSELFTRKV